jgi:hypothetical protein
MMNVQVMKNLWTFFRLFLNPRIVHSLTLQTRDFAPMSMGRQRIDLAKHSGVIPLRGCSY